MKKVSYEELREEIYKHPEGGVIFSDDSGEIHISDGYFGATTLEFNLGKCDGQLFDYDFNIEEEAYPRAPYYILYSDEDLETLIVKLIITREIRRKWRKENESKEK